MNEKNTSVEELHREFLQRHEERWQKVVEALEAAHAVSRAPIDEYEDTCEQLDRINQQLRAMVFSNTESEEV